MLAIAQNLVRDSMWGVVYRVSVGVAFSTTDAATDVYTILVYKAAGLTGRATALALMMGLNMLLQLGLVWFQYRKKSWKKKLYECAICLVFLRPAVDAYRVATNHVDKDLMCDPLGEMVCNKGAELFSESIPGCVLQCYVLLENPELISVGAVASLLISATTTGFTSSMITFDLDVDSSHRKNQPAFYGFIPDSHVLRGRCFMLMTGISMLHNLSTSVGCALLAVTDTSFLIYIVGGNVVFYLVFKVSRNDLMYWPRVEGVTGVILSFLVRINVKVIADFTGFVHSRHPFELGGAMFTASVVWAQIFPFVALEFFFEGEKKEELRAFLTTSCASWFVLNFLFFATINSSHIHTFFSLKTAPVYTVELFSESNNDSVKYDAVFTNRISYTSSVHDEIKQWVAANIEDWRRDMPEWFHLKDIPDEFLPAAIITAEGGAKRRRRSVSVRDILTGHS